MAITLTKRLQATRALWANPVVTRDLRVRMRGSKSYWHQAFYLGLLGVLALAGYGTAVGWGNTADPNGMSAVDVQQHLQSFYYFIFITLAALITLIAPALTAVSITTERQRLSLDLLVTTPLTAPELLVGKMLSSTAFLALLLALSLPASALCVILGGATLGDVIRVYLLLAVDGLVLAALGLLVSCATRASLPALVWTYLSVAGFLALTAFAYFATLASMYGRSAGTTISPAASVGALNPFVAVYIGGQSFDVGSVHVPLWLGVGVIAVLLIRLLVTAAAYRLGRYGGSPIGSLRRQLLLLSGLGVFGLAYGVFARAASMSALSGALRSAVTFDMLEGGLLFVFALSGLLLPSLFTPATPSEDDPPGIAVDGWYSPRQAFFPEHAGSLPFFHLWLVCVVLSAMGGLWAAGVVEARDWPPVLLTAFYLSGVGFLFWALCRRTASWVRGVTAGRALGFVLFAVLAWLPIAVLMLFSATSTDLQIKDSPLSWFWIFYPTLRMETGSWQDGTAILALVWSGVLCYGLGLLAYPFWRSVVPGGQPKAEKQNANAV